MSDDAERYEDRNPLAAGKPVPKGFQDPSGSYPKFEGLNQPDSPIGSPDVTTNSGTRGARASSSVASSGASIIGRSDAKSNPSYPYNNITITSSGHKIEYDDTPGYERICVRHRTGSKIEMFGNGDVEVVSEGSRYSVVAGDNEIVIRGMVNIVIESSAAIRVQGNVDLEVDGDMNQLIMGNHNIEVVGDSNTRVHGDVSNSVTGGRLIETRGNEIRRYLSNVRERIVGDHTIEMGGTFQLSTESNYNVYSYGTVNMSFFGGFVTLNGENSDGEAGEGELIYHTSYSSNIHTDDVFASKDINVRQGIIANTGDFEGNVKAASMDASTFEGLAKRAEYANTAGQAPSGPPSVRTPTPALPDSVENREDEPDTSLIVEDVLETSDQFILNLDRSSVHNYNSRILNTSEVTSRCRNPNLLQDSVWLRDQVETEAILESIVSSSAPRSQREFTKIDNISSGNTTIGNSSGTGSFVSNPGNTINFTIPSFMKIVSGVSPNTKLSPNFFLSHMISGDGEPSKLISQSGLSAIEIAQNMQVLSYTVLEPLRNKFNDRWTISEGLYNSFENEEIVEGSINDYMSRGLAVGIQFPDMNNSRYFEVAAWAANNLVYEAVILSYVDYDPMRVNEPTLIIMIKTGTNSKALNTEFNHVTISDTLRDLSDGT